MKSPEGISNARSLLARNLKAVNLAKCGVPLVPPVLVMLTPLVSPQGLENRPDSKLSFKTVCANQRPAKQEKKPADNGSRRAV